MSWTAVSLLWAVTAALIPIAGVFGIRIGEMREQDRWRKKLVVGIDPAGKDGVDTFVIGLKDDDGTFRILNVGQVER